MLASNLMEQFCTSQQLYRSFTPGEEPWVLVRCSSSTALLNSQFPIAFCKLSEVQYNLGRESSNHEEAPTCRTVCHLSAAARRDGYRAGQKQSVGSGSCCSCNTWAGSRQPSYFSGAVASLETDAFHSTPLQVEIILTKHCIRVYALAINNLDWIAANQTSEVI